MPDPSNENVEKTLPAELKVLEKHLMKAGDDASRKVTRDLITVQNRLYSQLESLSWLQRRLAIKGELSPLRGWAGSPDVLLRLHAHIMATRPRIIVELGSGVSTLVIADALRQNGVGQLMSFEHSDHFAAQTLGTLQAERLEGWVDLRIGDLEAWQGEHLNPEDAEKPSLWYPVSLLEGIENVDLLWVDGPPAATCLFSRYPALPALADRLSANAEVWMDDTIRQEEKDICERWAADHGFELEYLPLEKGLGRLTRPHVKRDKTARMIGCPPAVTLGNNEMVQIYPDEFVVLEYGSAYSAGIAAAAPDRFIMSVEDDRNRARELRQALSGCESPVVVFNSGTTSAELRGSMHGVETAEPFLRYAGEIWEQPFFRDPDVILIAGRFRLACLATVMQRIRTPTRVLFDDYADQLRYQEIERVVKPTRMLGRMAEFELAPDMAQGAVLDFLSRQYSVTTPDKDG